MHKLDKIKYILLYCVYVKLLTYNDSTNGTCSLDLTSLHHKRWEAPYYNIYVTYYKYKYIVCKTSL